eukprot:GHRQ01036534.1.p1 GENE.GHRQ01036534.1~~GHRQ01036534.1.p1  ORF type:complete len:152 (+),score=61.45 GHRQ01036534.1:208-663(+)
MFSITEQFNSSVVLLTGATGYVGRLVLESLLRTTAVEQVYVLLRAKDSSSADDRLSMLLQSSMFHKVREQQQLLAKVSAVAGDIAQPGLGLASGSAQQLQQRLTIILHCAADIRLEVSRQAWTGCSEVIAAQAPAANENIWINSGSAWVRR